MIYSKEQAALLQLTELKRSVTFRLVEIRRYEDKLQRLMGQLTIDEFTEQAKDYMEQLSIQSLKLVKFSNRIRQQKLMIKEASSYLNGGSGSEKLIQGLNMLRKTMYEVETDYLRLKNGYTKFLERYIERQPAFLL